MEKLPVFQPIDTSHIKLPAELEPLLEDLARNVHEVWAAGRIADGWTLGPRNDEARTHPCLVPYDDLDEIEKDYDRRTSLQTLLFILASGFDIVPAEGHSKKNN